MCEKLKIVSKDMKKNLILGAAAAVTTLVAAPQAHATAELMLISGASTVTIVDGLAGDSNPNPGVVTYIGAVGGWSINVTTGNGNPTGAMIDVNSIDDTSGSANGLTIAFSQTGYTYTGGIFADIGGTTAGTVHGDPAGFAVYQGINNLNFQLSNLIALTSSVNGSAVGFVGGPTPYSLTEVVTLDGGKSPGGSASFDAQVKTPDGGTTLVMLGGAMIGLVGLRSRFAKRG